MRQERFNLQPAHLGRVPLPVKADEGLHPDMRVSSVRALQCIRRRRSRSRSNTRVAQSGDRSMLGRERRYLRGAAIGDTTGIMVIPQAACSPSARLSACCFRRDLMPYRHTVKWEKLMTRQRLAADRRCRSGAQHVCLADVRCLPRTR